MRSARYEQASPHIDGGLQPRLEEPRAVQPDDRFAQRPGVSVDELDDRHHAHAEAPCERRLAEALRAALTELPPRCREVLILHKFEGLSYAEIAAKLGIAKNTVTVHLAKAMRLLRRGMREAGTDGDLR